MVSLKACTVYLPHLNYTVHFRKFKQPPASIEKAKAWCERNNHSSCTVYFNTRETYSSLAHELVHVLRHICVDRLMKFECEVEHMAYLMQYLMGRALGHEWVQDDK